MFEGCFRESLEDADPDGEESLEVTLATVGTEWKLFWMLSVTETGLLFYFGFILYYSCMLGAFCYEVSGFLWMW